MARTQRRAWIRGQFEVVRVTRRAPESRVRTDTVTGRLIEDGRTTTVVSVPHTFPPSTLPEPGTTLAARWRRDRPQQGRVEWTGTGIVADAARIERDRRAAALGLDPQGLRADAVPTGSSPADALQMWAHNGVLLPDGSRVVSAGEAARIRRDGEPAQALVVAVDHLRASPGSVPDGSSVSNVALDVSVAGGATYRVLARFEFPADGEREQVAHPGTRVAVRVSRDDRSRIALDRGPPSAA